MLVATNTDQDNDSSIDRFTDSKDNELLALDNSIVHRSAQI